MTILVLICPICGKPFLEANNTLGYCNPCYKNVLKYLKEILGPNYEKENN